MRVMVLTALYGSGHKTVAKALVQALKSLGVEHDSLEFGVLDIVEEGGFTEKFSSRAYEILMRRGHRVWKALYNAQALAASPFRKIYRFQVRHFVRALERYRPDAVISTHFLTSLIGVIYKSRSGKKVFTVITDLSVHPLWVWEGTDTYYVGLERTAEEEVLRGKEVVVSGIPLRRDFWNPPSKFRAREDLGYPRERTVVLLSAGSYASVRVEPIVEGLKKMGAFVVLLAGRRKEAYRRYLHLFDTLGIEGVVYPFVDFVPKIMAASDIFITKAGGVSVSEALAVGLPMVFIDNMPGQEEMNAKILEELGAGLNVGSPEHVLDAVSDLLRDGGRLEHMSMRAKSLGKPRAALTVVEDVVRRTLG